MTYENIHFSKPNMTYFDGYFYFFDEENDLLWQRLADGDTAFTYGLSTCISNVVNSLECDSLFFWTLEQNGNDVLIRRWYLNNDLCYLDEEYTFTNFTSEAFSIEYYTSVLSTAISSGTLQFYIDDDLSFITSDGLAYLKSDTYKERIFISTISGTTSGSLIILDEPIEHDYSIGDNFYISTYILLIIDGYLYKHPVLSGTKASEYHWDGDHVNKSGNWEYTIASNTNLDSGVYKVTFDAYDADYDYEIALRIEGMSTTYDVIARREGNNAWVTQTNLLYISASGTYDVKGRQRINNTYSWGLDNVTLTKDPLLKTSTYVNYWAGDHTNKSGHWEYTIASNIDLDIGAYYIIYDAYDNDTDGEMGIRLDGPDIIDIKAHLTGNNSWITQTATFFITTSGTYDIKGRQYKSSSYRWGVDAVILHKIEFNGMFYTVTDFDSISSCVFSKVIGVTSEPKYYLVYNRDTNLKFLNLNTMNIDAVATIDNVKTNNDIIKIYDLAIDDTNIFRLQKEAKYYETDYSWSDYNYVLSTTRRFVDTINASAYPIILPANAINVAKISIIVNDQYGEGIKNKPVFVTDDDTIGFITISPAYTDYFFGTGEAVTYYKAGTEIRTVTIESRATQFD